jgi:1,4-dihydroxy-2-naphthoyl-CoA synthase
VVVVIAAIAVAVVVCEPKCADEARCADLSGRIVSTDTASGGARILQLVGHMQAFRAIFLRCRSHSETCRLKFA